MSTETLPRSARDGRKFKLVPVTVTELPHVASLSAGSTVSMKGTPGRGAVPPKAEMPPSAPGGLVFGVTDEPPVGVADGDEGELVAAVVAPPGPDDAELGASGDDGPLAVGTPLYTVAAVPVAAV